MNKFNIENDFWNTLDSWLSKDVDKVRLSELFISAGTFMIQEIAGEEVGRKLVVEHIRNYGRQENKTTSR